MTSIILDQLIRQGLLSAALVWLIEQGATTMPQRQLMRLEHLSINMLNVWYRTGELDSVVIGGRQRRVFIESYINLLWRRFHGLARPEAERLAAVEAYLRSLSNEGAANAARARTGISPETRARGRRKRAALAVPRQSAALPPKPRDRSRKSSPTEKGNPATA
jgi:hypothetical protein